MRGAGLARTTASMSSFGRFRPPHVDTRQLGKRGNQAGVNPCPSLRSIGESVAAQQSVERPAVLLVHREVGGVVGLEAGADAHHVRMLEAGERPGFRPETGSSLTRSPPGRQPTSGGPPCREQPLGREVRIHGASVRATRNPMKLLRWRRVKPVRYAVRRSDGLSLHEPPRKMRRQHWPLCHALPFGGAPV